MPQKSPPEGRNSPFGRTRPHFHAEPKQFYIAQDSGSIKPAERVIWKLHEKIVTLAASPGIGRRCDDIDPGGRCSPIGSYIVYYREDSRRIVITHVFHAKRDQSKAWKQK